MLWAILVVLFIGICGFLGFAEETKQKYQKIIAIIFAVICFIIIFIIGVGAELNKVIGFRILRILSIGAFFYYFSKHKRNNKQLENKKNEE